MGRIAFGMRNYLSLGGGTYDGFDISQYKVDFLRETLTKAYPNFRVQLADIRNTTYNRAGRIDGSQFQFPFQDSSFDVVFAASVFTHMLPATTAQYFKEAARVLRNNGRCVFSSFLLDHYRHGRKRPSSFQQTYFDLDHPFQNYGEDFAVAQLGNPEDMTGYQISFVERLAVAAGLKLDREPLPGLWSGSFDHWYGAQDLVVLWKCSKVEYLAQRFRFSLGDFFRHLKHRVP